MTKSNRSRRSFWTMVVVFALLGAVAGYSGAEFFDNRAGGDTASMPDTSELAALLVGAVFLICAVVVGLGSANARIGMAMNVFDDVEHWRDDRRLLGASAAGAGAWGAALVLLALARPFGWAQEAWLAVLLIALAVLLAAMTWATWRRFDELWREVNTESCTLSFFGIFAVGSAWSGLAHLGQVEALAPLDWITLISGFSLVGSIIATARRGLVRT